ncbi:SPFH domain-containing protein [Kineosporia babensis]|uniref:SPFH domain-containing protein n=1 Tax=Kineosporia babensis TaxID=499548 RepID=A0A9X1SX18_9ACTN|nr:SPFH domain-containing protein [Kineosporia babensis]MCD5314665.1 SPFH domain-containing protein [Kineosporia babensis]
MAEIRRYPLVWHVRSATTDHLVHVRRGRTVHSGPGQAFWFRPLSAALSEVPIDDRELGLLFHARTADFQDVSVQATVAYRMADPDLAARRLDFGLDPKKGTWRGRPLEQIAQMLTEAAQQHALDLLTGFTLHQALTAGLAAVRERMATGLSSDERLSATGVEVVDVRVIALRPEADVERALQTPAREQVQQEADKATYERRALAVERERAISENELQSQIELAAREEQLVSRRGANERRRATEAAAAGRIETEAKAEQTRLLADARAESTRLVGAADAETEAARMAIYADMDQAVLLALAAREAAKNLPQVGSLTITPDAVTSALTALSR